MAVLTLTAPIFGCIGVRADYLLGYPAHALVKGGKDVPARFNL